MDIMQKVPVITDGLTIREIDDEIIILVEKNEEIHNLEGTAAFLWKMIDGKNRVEDILNRLLAEYEVPAAVALPDLNEYLEECKNKGLIYFREK